LINALTRIVTTQKTPHIFNGLFQRSSIHQIWEGYPEFYIS
jgi:hypothetical protein